MHGDLILQIAPQELQTKSGLKNPLLNQIEMLGTIVNFSSPKASKQIDTKTTKSLSQSAVTVGALMQ